MKDKNLTAILYALAAACFYALNVPCSKLMLAHVPSTLMAAYLYLGAGLGVGVLYLFHRKQERREERLTRADLPYTVGMVALDIAAPILLMSGVNLGTASGASLLGNFEIVATTVLALCLFHERVSGRLWLAIGLITLSSILLSLDGGSLRLSPASLLVLGATVCWGLENNCTRQISGKSTYQIVTIKGVFSGLGALATALLLGQRPGEGRYIVLAMLLGFVAYGLSIFTYIRAQRALGAARTSAFYAAAPFLGALLSFLLLREPLTPSYAVALAVMLPGTALTVCDTFAHTRSHMGEDSHRRGHGAREHRREPSGRGQG